MQNLIILLICFLFSLSNAAQDNINPPSKLLKRHINKVYNSQSYSLAEIENISSSNKDTSLGKYYTITDKHIIGYLFIGRVMTCRAGVCMPSVENENLFEFFDYFILYDKDGKVLFVKVYNYEATHGQEITSDAWLRQFKGYDGSQLLKPGVNIDAITGATISVSAITENVIEVTRNLRNYLENHSR